MIRTIITGIVCFGFINAHAFTKIHSGHSVGITFEKEKSWDEIKSKAKAEGKYIFVDCFATWCAPCKKMDTEVYSSDSVGAFANSSFISVKIQMDTTTYDTKSIKHWYSVAHKMRVDYGVYAYPTFLFFSPEGKLVHRGMGFMEKKEFVDLLSQASNPGKQYYTMLEKYRKGEKNVSNMALLMKTAKALNDTAALNEIGFYYARDYLDNLSPSEILTEDNIEILREFTKTSTEKGFELFFKKQREIDSIMGIKGYSRHMIDDIIYQEELKPRVALAKSSNQEPNWDLIGTSISRKYSLTFANRLVARGNVAWYRWRQDWSSYTRSILALLSFSPSEDMNNWFFINGEAWEIFNHSTKRSEQETAVECLAKIVMKKDKSNGYNSAVLDTYANLLYKLGRSQDAIQWETEASKIAPWDNQVKDALQKMEKGLPTWTADSK